MPSSDIVTTSVAITTKEIIELKSCAKTEECNEIFLGDIQKAYFAHSALVGAEINQPTHNITDFQKLKEIRKSQIFSAQNHWI